MTTTTAMIIPFQDWTEHGTPAGYVLVNFSLYNRCFVGILKEDLEAYKTLAHIEEPTDCLRHGWRGRFR